MTEIHRFRAIDWLTENYRNRMEPGSGSDPYSVWDSFSTPEERMVLAAPMQDRNEAGMEIPPARPVARILSEAQIRRGAADHKGGWRRLCTWHSREHCRESDAWQW
jgi:hypothetical protein